ncbi:hypothetical protein HCUR_00758 [Holospora curviuscula]|uniref:Transposase DDE domain-containing protein n=1 Tax=Holospora curviuscula TaxID=1082868 RepID=A0A2S5R8Y0_9PROT|nr:hypothetical protein HCUR_00758 [Holospora curviuscula]
MFAKRWVLERTLAWLNHYPRLSTEYEMALAAVENRVMITHSMRLLMRIANP